MTDVRISDKEQGALTGEVGKNPENCSKKAAVSMYNVLNCGFLYTIRCCVNNP